MDALKQFKFGLAEYRARRFEKAVGAFTEVLKIHSKDKPAHLYIERSQHVIANAPRRLGRGVGHARQVVSRLSGDAVDSPAAPLEYLSLAGACVTMCHMKTISIRELHERTGEWVRKVARLGPITVTERGRPIARIEAVEERGRTNPFLTRKLRPGYKRLRGRLTGGTDTVTIVSEDRGG